MPGVNRQHHINQALLLISVISAFGKKDHKSKVILSYTMNEFKASLWRMRSCVKLKQANKKVGMVLHLA